MTDTITWQGRFPWLTLAKPEASHRWLQLRKFQKDKEFHMWNYQRSLLDLHDSPFGSLATYLYADALFNWTNPQTLSPHFKQWLLNLKHINKWSQFRIWTVPTTANGVFVSLLVFRPLISGWSWELSLLSTKHILSPLMQLLQLLRSMQG